MVIPKINKQNKENDINPDSDVYSPSGIFISRVAYIFVIFAVISGGYISEILSCQLRNLFEYNIFYIL